MLARVCEYRIVLCVNRRRCTSEKMKNIYLKFCHVVWIMCLLLRARVNAPLSWNQQPCFIESFPSVRWCESRKIRQTEVTLDSQTSAMCWLTFGEDWGVMLKFSELLKPRCGAIRLVFAGGQKAMGILQGVNAYNNQVVAVPWDWDAWVTGNN